MQRQRGDLVPIGEAFSDLSGPVAALRDALPQARRGFTVADQVHQLVSASEADPERGFMVRMMALCSRHCHVNWLTMDQGHHIDYSDVVLLTISVGLSQLVMR